ncbi:MAG: VOC family protein, partial [Pseudonocardia sp.]|nr:VOC family protein [Pseudonocardia sp.]
AEAAARYYTSVFRDATLGKVTRYGKANPEREGQVLTVEFELNGQKFVALNGGPRFTFDEAISFQVPCADQDEIDYYWEKLTEGGEEGPCGWAKDRFGLSWQVGSPELIDMVADPDPEKARRATEAMYTMKKIDLAAIRKAHAGG